MHLYSLCTHNNIYIRMSQMCNHSDMRSWCINTHYIINSVSFFYNTEQMRGDSFLQTVTFNTVWLTILQPHSNVLRFASKWLISPWALRRSSPESRTACANVSSGNVVLSWAPEHRPYFTSRMLTLRELQVIPLPAVDTQYTLCSNVTLVIRWAILQCGQFSKKHCSWIFFLNAGWKLEAALKTCPGRLKGRMYTCVHPL